MVVCGAICLILLLCSAVPVKFALALHLNETIGFGAGISLFSNRRALRSARDKQKPWKWKHPAGKPDLRRLLRAAWHAAAYLLRHIRIPVLRIDGSLALGDAAHTALFCGALQSIGGMLPAAQVQLQPDFSSVHSNAQLICIISLRTGHIILAALLGAWHYFSRRSTHGKASD